MRPTLPLLLLAGSTVHALRIPRYINDTLVAAAPPEPAFETRQQPTVPSPAVASHPAASTPASRQPILPGDDDAVLVVVVEGAEGEPKAEAANWSCDVRAWVRAADLEPNSFTEAHARLAANGTDCSDIESWSVGLRYKQRMITRLHAPGASFPIRPVWSPELESGSLWNLNEDVDIFDLGNRWRRGSSPYEEMMDEYNKIISDAALWEVHAAEHVIFDSQLELASTKDVGNSFPLEDIKAFQVAVPNTNLPPRAEHDGLSHRNNDAEMVNSETLFEYYFAMRLKNGSTLDFPAGRASFVPAGLAEKDGPVETIVVNFSSQRDGQKQRRYADRFGSRGVPACDQGNFTSFRLELEIPAARTFALDSTTYLPATLYTTSNGTEYPFNLTVQTGDANEVRWLEQFPRATDANLTSTARRNNMAHGRMLGMLVGAEERLLRIKPDEVERAERESSSYRYFGSLDGGPLALDGRATVQHLKIPVHIDYHTMPDFRTAFVDYVSSLRLFIQTRFACDEAINTPVMMSDNDDALWTGWVLPHPVFEQEHSRRRDFVHEANVSITVVGPPPSATAPPTHYLDDGALAPVLTLPGASGLVFPPIGAVRVEEGSEELKERRYGRGCCGSYTRWFRPAGEHEHAGAVWQRYEKSLEAAAAAAGKADEAPTVDVAVGVSPRPAQGVLVVPAELAQSPA